MVLPGLGEGDPEDSGSAEGELIGTLEGETEVASVGSGAFVGSQEFCSWETDIAVSGEVPPEKEDTPPSLPQIARKMIAHMLEERENSNGSAARLRFHCTGPKTESKARGISYNLRISEELTRRFIALFG